MQTITEPTWAGLSTGSSDSIDGFQSPPDSLFSHPVCERSDGMILPFWVTVFTFVPIRALLTIWTNWRSRVRTNWSLAQEVVQAGTVAS